MLTFVWTCDTRACYVTSWVGWGGGARLTIVWTCDTRACYVTSWVGWGGGDVKFLHIERKITSVVHSHPPSHYICKHAFLPTTWLLMMFVHYPPFPQITSSVVVFKWDGWNLKHTLSTMVVHCTGIHKQIYIQNKAQAHCTWEITRISPGLARVTFKCTVKMKPRRILREKTQRFLRGRRGWHNKFIVKMKPRRILYEKTQRFLRGWRGVTYNSTIKMKPKRILHEKTQWFLRGWRGRHVYL